MSKRLRWSLLGGLVLLILVVSLAAALLLAGPPSTSRPGMPITVAPGGTSFTTTEFEPMRAPSPTVKAPRILAPAPTTTPAPKVGWRLVPAASEVPPRVTPW